MDSVSGSGESHRVLSVYEHIERVSIGVNAAKSIIPLRISKQLHISSDPNYKILNKLFLQCLLCATMAMLV